MILRQLIPTFFALTIIAFACSSEYADADKDHLTGGDQRRNVLIEKAGLSAAPFSITEVKFTAPGSRTLEIDVLRPSSCEGSFDFFWDGSVALSYPAQLYIVLRYKGSCAHDQLTEKETLTLDLMDFLRHPDVDENTIVHIINGSVTHPSNDKNVSSK